MLATMDSETDLIIEYTRPLPDDYFIQEERQQARTIVASCAECSGQFWCSVCDGAGHDCDPCNDNGFCSECWGRLKDAGLGHVEMEEALNV